MAGASFSLVLLLCAYVAADVLLDQNASSSTLGSRNLPQSRLWQVRLLAFTLQPPLVEMPFEKALFFFLHTALISI